MRVKVWQDTGEVEVNPTWLRDSAYAALPIVNNDADFRDFETAKAAYEAAKQRLVAGLSPPEPLSDEERSVLKTDEVIA